MDRIFLVIADYGYDGQVAVRAFGTEPEAVDFRDKCNDYQRSPDRYLQRGGFRMRNPVWENNHPAAGSSDCEQFEVEEVPFGAAPAHPGDQK